MLRAEESLQLPLAARSGADEVVSSGVAVGVVSGFSPFDQREIRSTMTKSIGTRKIAKAVENATPTIVTVPIRRRATPPAPRAVHSGIRPKMKANEVIRIGRRRERAPFRAASTIDSPFSSSVLANSTIRMALL